MESWHSTFEFECLARQHCATRAEARRDLARFIDWYNRARRHRAFEMRSPLDYEA
jgi:putative transposase